MTNNDPKSPVTNEMLQQAVDAIIAGVERMLGDGLSGLRTEMTTRFEKLESGQRDIKRQINDLKIDIPTRKEFEDLKSRVNKHNPGTRSL